MVKSFSGRWSLLVMLSPYKKSPQGHLFPSGPKKPPIEQYKSLFFAARKSNDDEKLVPSLLGSNFSNAVCWNFNRVL